MSTQRRLGNDSNDTADIAVVGSELVTLLAATTYTGASTVKVTLTSALLAAAKVLYATVAPRANAAAMAIAIKAALNADAAVTALYTVGGSSADITLTAKTKAADDTTLNLAIANGTSVGVTAAPTSTDSTPGVAPVKQAETATVVGVITFAGHATVVVTADGIAETTVSVAVALADTAVLVAGKIRAALALNAVVAGFFTIGGTGADVALTALAAAADDATMNISVDNGDCTGLTTAGTSADTTAGVAGTAQVETATAVGTIATGTTVAEAAVAGLGQYKQALVELILTDAKAASGDTLDVFVDTSIDGTTFVNAIHFTQILGDGLDAISICAVLDPGGAPGTSVVVTTADAAAAAQRPTVFGDRLRVRHTIVDGGAHGQSFTFAVSALLKA